MKMANIPAILSVAGARMQVGGWTPELQNMPFTVISVAATANTRPDGIVFLGTMWKADAGDKQRHDEPPVNQRQSQHHSVIHKNANPSALAKTLSHGVDLVTMSPKGRIEESDTESRRPVAVK